MSLKADKDKDKKSNPLKERNELIIHGYIHEFQKSTPQDNKTKIPSVIFDLCHMFYHVVSQWNIKSSFIDKIDPDIVYHEYNGNGWVTLRDHVALKDSYTFDKGKHHFKWKLLSDPSDNCRFTIHGQKSNWQIYEFNAGTAVSSGGEGKGFAAVGGGHGYGIKCKKDDIIDMFVDVEGESVSWAINGKNYGKAWSVEKNTYQVGVYLNGDKVKFMSYDNKF